jgi:hypothetical protein
MTNEKSNQNRHNLVAIDREVVVFIEIFGGGGGSRTLKKSVITNG